MSKLNEEANIINRSPPDILKLIEEEQQRQSGGFIRGIGLDKYVYKIVAEAEFVSSYKDDSCQGFIAFYCNDLDKKISFITLVLVVPIARGTGIAKCLVNQVLKIAKRRGFMKCQLEVQKENGAALGLYANLGFLIREDRGDRVLMEIVFDC